jgi:ABC-type nitrate/sulfonate/bicarbonate transport system permease component
VRSILRPDILPPTQALLETFLQLVGGPARQTGDAHHHGSDHVSTLVREQVSLRHSLLVSATRVLVGLLLGAPLGLVTGLLMGWSRRVDGYLHPLFVLVRSIPPLAVITYVMLWFGHGEMHLLIPIAYAVFTTVVIPTYHGVRDLAEIYVNAARAVGARGGLLFWRVVLPATGPAALSGLRYALHMAWMTAVGVEMLMADSGMGYFLVGGGIWSSRLTLGVDPAVVMVGIVGLATAGYAMDAAFRALAGGLTAWTRGHRP